VFRAGFPAMVFIGYHSVRRVFKAIRKAARIEPGDRSEFFRFFLLIQTIPNETFHSFAGYSPSLGFLVRECQDSYPSFPAKTIRALTLSSQFCNGNDK
jgi:hypothetical protein